MRRFLPMLLSILCLLPGWLSADNPPYRLLPAPPQPGLTPREGGSLPLDDTWHDSRGRALSLRDALGDDELPVLLYPGYSRCTLLCWPGIQSLAAELRTAGLRAGRDFRFVFASIDPTEDAPVAARAREEFVAELDPPVAASSVQFLHSADTTAIDRLADALGIDYRPIPGTTEFAHPALLVLLVDKTIAGYMPSITADAVTLRQTFAARRSSLGEALTILGCAHYDPETGRYTPAATGLLRWSVLLTLGALAAFMWVQQRSRRGASA